MVLGGQYVMHGHCKLAFRVKYMYRKRRKEKRDQGGMFLEMEEEGAE